MSETTSAADQTLRRERDLYRALLELGCCDEIEPFLEEALALVVELTGARRGYIELVEDRDGDGPPRFWMEHGCAGDDVEAIRASFSRGIIGEAIATGRTIVTESARQDPRFAASKSVQRNLTEAVLCAPLGTLGAPPLGVVYLQDRYQPEPFSEDDRKRIDDVARYLTRFAHRLLLTKRVSDDADHTLPFRKRIHADGVIGRSKAIAEVLRLASQVAPLDVSVIITGPSGTGKTQLARVLHENSPRASGRFVEQNCAAFVETLLESELFGSLPGAHSTATHRTEGRVAAAEGGTLFLDEVGELSPAAQAKLLQLLQSRLYYPLGASEPVKANVRVVAATNADLQELCARKAFREDLYYRLHVMPIAMPSLAERPEDVPLLAAHFCEVACDANRLKRLRFSADALHALEAAEWPGNVRELDNHVQRAAIVASAEGALEIERRHVFPDRISSPGSPATFQQETRRLQQQVLERTLEETEWNVSKTGRQLGLSRSHVYNLIAAFGLRRKPR